MLLRATASNALRLVKKSELNPRAFKHSLQFAMEPPRKHFSSGPRPQASGDVRRSGPASGGGGGGGPRPQGGSGSGGGPKPPRARPDGEARPPKKEGSPFGGFDGPAPAAGAPPAQLSREPGTGAPRRKRRKNNKPRPAAAVGGATAADAEGMDDEEEELGGEDDAMGGAAAPSPAVSLKHKAPAHAQLPRGLTLPGPAHGSSNHSSSSSSSSAYAAPGPYEPTPVAGGGGTGGSGISKAFLSEKRWADPSVSGLLSRGTQRALAEGFKFEHLSKVQEATLPLLLTGGCRDVFEQVLQVANCVKQPFKSLCHSFLYRIVYLAFPAIFCSICRRGRVCQGQDGRRQDAGLPHPCA